MARLESFRGASSTERLLPRRCFKPRWAVSDRAGMPLSQERGMTIIEVMLAMLMLLTAGFATISMIDRANANGSVAKSRDRATSLTRDLIEASRGIPYPDLVSTKYETQLTATEGLEDAKPSTAAYEIERGNVTYTVTPTVCAVDDAKDGLGPHPGGTNFCAGSAGTADTVPDDYRRVKIELAWRIDGKDRTMRQATTINNPGSAFGPAVTSIDPVGTFLQPIGLPLTVYDEYVNINFDITTNRSADAVRWAVDGADMGPAAKKGGSDTVWDASWFIATLVDGTYLLSAQAYDTSGLSAGPYTKSIVLNRFAPFPPTGVVAGANKASDWSLLPLNLKYKVDIEWLPNRERDITGYRVYRLLGTSANPLTDTQVCSVSEKTTNCPTTFTASSLAASLVYYVVALDKDKDGNTRASLPSAPAVVNLANIPPTAVRNLTATTVGSTVTLDWDEPSSAGELTDKIDFYRIYRNGVRHDRVGISSDLNYVTQTGAQYWVSAVDTQLGESPLSGPVP